MKYISVLSIAWCATILVSCDNSQITHDTATEASYSARVPNTSEIPKISTGISPELRSYIFDECIDLFTGIRKSCPFEFNEVQYNAMAATTGKYQYIQNTSELTTNTSTTMGGSIAYGDLEKTGISITTKVEAIRNETIKNNEVMAIYTFEQPIFELYNDAPTWKNTSDNNLTAAAFYSKYGTSYLRRVKIGRAGLLLFKFTNNSHTQFTKDQLTLGLKARLGQASLSADYLSATEITALQTQTSVSVEQILPNSIIPWAPASNDLGSVISAFNSSMQSSTPTAYSYLWSSYDCTTSPAGDACKVGALNANNIVNYKRQWEALLARANANTYGATSIIPRQISVVTNTYNTMLTNQTTNITNPASNSNYLLLKNQLDQYDQLTTQPHGPNNEVLKLTITYRYNYVERVWSRTVPADQMPTKKNGWYQYPVYRDINWVPMPAGPDDNVIKVQVARGAKYDDWKKFVGNEPQVIFWEHSSIPRTGYPAGEANMLRLNVNSNQNEIAWYANGRRFSSITFLR